MEVDENKTASNDNDMASRWLGTGMESKRCERLLGRDCEFGNCIKTLTAEGEAVGGEGKGEERQGAGKRYHYA